MAQHRGEFDDTRITVATRRLVARWMFQAWKMKILTQVSERGKRFSSPIFHEATRASAYYWNNKLCSMSAITRNYTRRRVRMAKLETPTGKTEEETKGEAANYCWCTIFAERTRSPAFNGIYRRPDTENASEKREGPCSPYSAELITVRGINESETTRLIIVARTRRGLFDLRNPSGDKRRWTTREASVSYRRLLFVHCFL